MMRLFNLTERRPLSLTSRVMLFVAIAISLSLLLIGHLVQSAVNRHFAEQDAEELVVISQAVEAALKKSQTAVIPPEEYLEHAVSGHHGVYFQVWDEDLRLIYGPVILESAEQLKHYAPLKSIRADNLYRWSVDETVYNGSVTQAQINGHPYRIVAAIDMDFHLHFLQNFNRTLWLIMTLAGGLTLLAAWFGIHKGHAPLRKLIETMRDIQANSLDRRLDTDSIPADLITLVDSFNRMLSRLQESFVKLSHFSDDIAHELRTPLTNLITQTQVGLSQSRNLEEYRELLYSSLEEQERLAKMVNDMLWLAQSENGLVKLNWQPLDLRQEVQATFDFFAAWAEEKHIQLQIDGQSAIISGDQAMLRRVLSNLLSNALRFTPGGEKVRVKIWQAENSAYLKVENPGPVIGSQHLPRLFDRFYRVDPSRYRQDEGVGLGLAIVKSIVEAHAGSIDVSSAHGVTAFIIRFPLVAITPNSEAGT